MALETTTGALAAVCTTCCYLPQVTKCWRTRSTKDLSLAMLALLNLGAILWAAYGVMRTDVVIVAANLTTLVLVFSLLILKLREG